MENDEWEAFQTKMKQSGIKVLQDAGRLALLDWANAVTPSTPTEGLKQNLGSIPETAGIELSLKRFGEKQDQMLGLLLSLAHERKVDSDPSKALNSKKRMARLPEVQARVERLKARHGGPGEAVQQKGSKPSRAS